MRCRECFKEFPEWTWDNPVCPACRGRTGSAQKPPVDSSFSVPSGAGAVEKSLSTEWQSLAEILAPAAENPKIESSGILTRGLEETRSPPQPEPSKDHSASARAAVSAAIRPLEKTAEPPKVIGRKFIREEDRPKTHAAAPEVRTAKSPSEKVLIEYSPRRFLRVNIPARGLTVAGVALISAFLFFFSAAIGFGLPWFLFPVGLWIFFNFFLRQWTAETLYLDRTQLRYEVAYLSFLSLKKTQKSDASIEIMILEAEGSRRYGNKGAAGKRKSRLVLSTRDWKIRIGRRIDEPDKLWLKKHLSQTIGDLFSDQ